MKKLTVKNTYNIKISGQPQASLSESNASKTVAVCPSSIPFVKAKKLVGIGDKVKIGTPLFLDKKNPDVSFVSPGAGEVVDIKYGHKRAIDEIVIKVDGDEDSVEITSLRAKDITEKNTGQVKDALLKSGLWSLLREYPFNRIPSPETKPPAIYVSCDQDEAFTPDSGIIYDRYLD